MNPGRLARHECVDNFILFEIKWIQSRDITLYLFRLQTTFFVFGCTYYKRKLFLSPWVQ